MATKIYKIFNKQSTVNHVVLDYIFKVSVINSSKFFEKLSQVVKMACDST